MTGNQAQTATRQCPRCGQKNRLREQFGCVAYKCGKCASPIHSPFVYLVFDCETTGLPSGRSDPHLVQIAWAIHEASGTAIEEHCYVIKPDGFSIPQSATRIHGIRDSVAQTHGIDARAVVTRFIESASFPFTRLVAHNIGFDSRVLRAELLRLQLKDDVLSRPQFCTMMATTDLCKLPKRGGGYKWPALQELHLHLLGNMFGGGHNALVDVQATARCFFNLMKMKSCRFG